MALDGSSAKSDPSFMKDAATGSTTDYIRLHITPLDQDLLNIILPAAVLPGARNISLHTIETFPEKRYGFVDLPAVDAEKLRKKLHGATLKGARMRVEKARPEKRLELSGHAPDPDANANADVYANSETKKSKKRKAIAESETPEKRKRDLNSVQGVALKDRKVKRGWTESTGTKIKSKRSKDRFPSSRDDKDQAQKKKRPKSKYTDQDECLLKTRVPPNAVGNLPPSEAYKKKKKGHTRQVTVHEFEKTTRFPSFLKNVVPHRDAKEAVEFVDGKGWVDEDGNIVEAVKTRDTCKSANSKPMKTIKAGDAEMEELESSDTSTSISGTSSSEDSTSDASDSDSSEEVLTVKKDGSAVAEEESSNDSSSSSETDADTDEEEEEEEEKPTDTQQDSRPISSSSSRSLTIKIPTTTTPAKIHPLEALYKRPKPSDPASTATPAPVESFSFFGGTQADDMEDEPPSLPIPMTPFTRQDFERRNVRSAAPTPDTAHPSRMKNFWTPGNGADDVLDEEVEEGEGEREGEGGEEAWATQLERQQQGGSDFQSWFWENRRDLNRSWMSRRKAAAKERRHIENKSRASKAI